LNLLAPITIRDHSFLAAGSTLNLEVPEGALAVARAKQRNVEGWMARREASPSKDDGAPSQDQNERKNERDQKDRPKKKPKAKKRGN
jgi:hypothetical protein